MLANDNNVFFSITKGIRLAFRDIDNVIVAEYSPFSGKETIRLNDQTVSQSRSYKLNSAHTIELPNSDVYKVKLEMKNIFMGKMQCSLFKNDTLKRRYKLFRTRNREWPTYVAIFLIAVVMGLVSGYFKMSAWYSVLACFIIVPITMILEKSRWEYEIAS